MLTTVFSGPYTTQWQRVDATWEQFRERLSQPVVAEKKDQVGLFSPAEFRPGGGKLKSAVLQIHFGVLDLDEVSPQGLYDLGGRLQEHGLRYVIASSWKHTRAAPRYRLIVPFDRPVPADQWAAFFPRLSRYLCPETDHSCKDPNRCYYWPSCPPERIDQFQAFSAEGAAIETTKILEQPAPPKQLPKVFTRVTREQFLAWGTRLARSKDEHLNAIGLLVAKIAKGHAYAEVGERDTVTFEVAKAIADQWPDSDPAELATLFRESLSHMAIDGGITEEQVAGKIRRSQDRVREDRDGLRRADFEDRKRRISEAFQDPNRTHPYTDSELGEIAKLNGCNIADLAHRWVVQTGKAFYVLGPKGYHHYLREEAPVAASIDLAPASSAGVEVFRFTPAGKVLLSAAELVSAYGTVAHGIEISLLEEGSRYDESRRVLVEGGPRKRPLRPVYDPHIDRWLDLLGGENAPQIKAWLKYAPDLSRPSAALCLFGHRGVGKSLLAHGVSQLWECQAPTNLKTVVNWTDRILVSPLLFADEELPKDSRGRVNTAWIREIIQARAIPLERKFMPGATITGSIRMIIAANNPEVLRTDDPLTRDDIDALAERFLMILCNGAAEAMFRSWVESDPIQAAEVTTHWARQGIAEHCLWLAEHYPHVPEGRFLVRGDSVSVQRSLATQGGLGSLVVQWIGEAVTSPARVPPEARKGLFCEPDGTLLVTTHAIEQGWSALLPWARHPTSRAVANELRKLGREGPRRTVDGRRVRTCEIDLIAIEEWAVEAGRCDYGDLLKLVKEESKGCQ